MERAFDALKELADVIGGETWPKAAEVPGFHSEGFPRARAGRLDQPAPEGLVDDLAEGASGSPSHGNQLGGDVVVEGECGAHIKMLVTKHFDVNSAWT